MARYPQPRTFDTPARRDLDGGFTGVDNRRDRSLLGQGGPGDAAGLLADAINVRVSRQQPETRRGCVTPIHFNAPATRSTIQGVGVYSDPTGIEWVVTADTDKLWFHADGWTPRCVDLPIGVVLGRCEIVQAFQNLLICRGAGLPVLEWNGDWHAPAVSVTPSPVAAEQTDYLEPLPPCEFGIVMADRFIFPISRDTFGWSDLLDYTRYDPALSVARVNAGEDDAIVGFARYQGNRLIIFKTQSVYFVRDFYGDLANIAMDRLPARIGCVARRTICEVGGDLMWLGDRGVYRLSQTEQDALRSQPVPVSLPIEGYIDRINWGYADQAAACVCGQLYILAVPVDGSTRNNAFLIFDITLGTWQGMDWYGAPPPETLTRRPRPELPFVEHSSPAGGDQTIAPGWPEGTPVMAQGMVVSDYCGERTAFVSDGQRLVALGQGTMDRIDGWEYDIATKIETRGYLLGELGDKRGLAVEVFCATRGARLSVDVLTDGVNERLPVLTDRERDRRKWRVHGKPAYSLDNWAKDFDGPHREDYSWVASDGPMLTAPGIPLELWQEYQTPLPMRRVGRWFSVRVESTAGQVRLLGCQVDTLPERSSAAHRT